MKHQLFPGMTPPVEEKVVPCRLCACTLVTEESLARGTCLGCEARVRVAKEVAQRVRQQKSLRRRLDAFHVYEEPEVLAPPVVEEPEELPVVD